MSELLQLLAQIPDSPKKQELISEVEKMSEMRSEIAAKVFNQALSDAMGVTDKNYAGEMILAIVIVVLAFVIGIIALSGCFAARTREGVEDSAEVRRYNPADYYRTSELVIS